MTLKRISPVITRFITSPPEVAPAKTPFAAPPVSPLSIQRPLGPSPSFFNQTVFVRKNAVFRTQKMAIEISGPPPPPAENYRGKVITKKTGGAFSPLVVEAQSEERKYNAIDLLWCRQV